MRFISTFYTWNITHIKVFKHKIPKLAVSSVNNVHL